MAKPKKEKFVVTKRWEQLPDDERIAEIRREMSDGGTNKSVARTLGTTPGSVAGYRFRESIPSTHKKFGGRRGKVQETFAPKPPALVEAPVPQPKPAPPPPPKPKPEPKAPAPVRRGEHVMEVEGPKLKMAPQGYECSYRDEEGRRCAYLPMESELDRPELDLDRCRLHQRKK